MSCLSRCSRITYFAIGSGVTPNHESSVIQMPLSYLSQILKRWNQYLESRSILFGSRLDM